ncbi:unnamed protein product, partial [Amoebophrya sp. A25]
RASAAERSRDVVPPLGERNRADDYVGTTTAALVHLDGTQPRVFPSRNIEPPTPELRAEEWLNENLPISHYTDATITMDFHVFEPRVVP